MPWEIKPKKNVPLSNVVVKLPSYQEIIQLLQDVDDSPYFSEHLYPLIGKWGGKDVTPILLVDLIKSAIQDFCMSKPMGKALEILLLQKVSTFSKVLVDDVFFQAELYKLFPDDTIF